MIIRTLFMNSQKKTQKNPYQFRMFEAVALGPK